MKLKRLQKRRDPETEQFEGIRKVRGPHKGHLHHDYEALPKPSKAQRARRKRQLREKYGKPPETARPTDFMGKEEHRQARAEVLAAAGYRCERCGDPTRLTLDHVVPRHLGGGNHAGNLQCLCEPCNVAKGLDIWKAAHGTTPIPFL